MRSEMRGMVISETLHGSFRVQVRWLQSLLTFENLSEYERDDSWRDVLWDGVVWGETEAHDYADQHHDFRGHKNLPSVVKQEKYVENN